MSRGYYLVAEHAKERYALCRRCERAVVEYAELQGWMVYHPFDSRRSNPGFPDLTLVRHWRMIFAELKTERGRVGPAQKVWQEALLRVAYRASNVEVFVWRPVDWPAIEGALQR